jgi:exodeoxyribonuclease VII small subunit
VGQLPFTVYRSPPTDHRTTEVLMPTYEELYRELEETVRKLESGDLPLAESLALFERSSRLVEQCNAQLDQAELRVRQLVAKPNGDLVAAPFEGNLAA